MITLLIYSKQQKSLILLHRFLQPPVTSPLLGPDILQIFKFDLFLIYLNKMLFWECHSQIPEQCHIFKDFSTYVHHEFVLQSFGNI